MSVLAAFIGAFVLTYIGVGYLALRLCFWLADRGDHG